MTHKEQVQVSAVLCQKWINLSEQIAYKESQLKKEFNVENQLNIDAEKYAKNESGLAKFLGLLRDWGLCLLLPGMPVALLFICFKLNLYTDFIKAYGQWVGVLALVLFIIACMISTILDKNKYKRRINKFKKNNKKSYENKSAEIHTYNANINSEIYKIKSKKVALEQQMRDKTVCCIHPDYWYAGPQLFYLIDAGRADTLKEAINLFENIKENERKRLAEEVAAEERRWAKIEQMLEEDEKLDKLKRTIQSAIYDIF